MTRVVNGSRGLHMVPAASRALWLGITVSAAMTVLGAPLTTTWTMAHRCVAAAAPLRRRGAVPLVPLDRGAPVSVLVRRAWAVDLAALVVDLVQAAEPDSATATGLVVATLTRVGRCRTAMVGAVASVRCKLPMALVAVQALGDIPGLAAAALVHGVVLLLTGRAASTVLAASPCHACLPVAAALGVPSVSVVQSPRDTSVSAGEALPGTIAALDAAVVSAPAADLAVILDPTAPLHVLT